MEISKKKAILITFNEFYDAALLETLDRLQFGEVVESHVIESQVKACSMTSVVHIHQPLMGFLDQLQRRHVQLDGLVVRKLHDDVERHFGDDVCICFRLAVLLCIGFLLVVRMVCRFRRRRARFRIRLLLLCF